MSTQHKHNLLATIIAFFHLHGKEIAKEGMALANLGIEVATEVKKLPPQATAEEKIDAGLNYIIAHKDELPEALLGEAFQDTAVSICEKALSVPVDLIIAAFKAKMG